MIVSFTVYGYIRESNNGWETTFVNMLLIGINSRRKLPREKEEEREQERSKIKEKKQERRRIR